MSLGNGNPKEGDKYSKVGGELLLISIAQ